MVCAAGVVAWDYGQEACGSVEAGWLDAAEGCGVYFVWGGEAGAVLGGYDARVYALGSVSAMVS